MIDWLAVYDRTSERCFYLPASELGEGRNRLHLRLTSTSNGQHQGIRYAADYEQLVVTQPALSEAPAE
jgi:hypothetical protein